VATREVDRSEVAMKSLARTRSSLIAALALAAFLSLEVPPARAATHGRWSALDASAPAPSPRREYAAVYDVVNQRYIVIAGAWGDNYGGYQLFNEIWTLSLGLTPAWNQLTIAGPTPGERHSPQWGYDPVRNRVLLFGGYGRHYPRDDYAYLNDVWQLSLDGTPAWTELFPSGTAPSGRLAGVAAYDILRQRFVGFGGTIGAPVDTWTLELSGDPAWTTVETNGVSPIGGYAMTSIFDPVRDRMLIFGGSTSDNYYGVTNDAWELSLIGDTPTWQKLDPLGPLPLARRSLTSIYDPLRDRMIIFGGFDGIPGSDAFLNDTWGLSLAGKPQWTELAPGGDMPVVRDAMAAAYDPIGDQMVVFGGWSGVTMLNDTQFLRWGAIGQSASMTGSSQAAIDAATLQWSVQNATGPRGAVYRRQVGTPWSSLATVQSQAGGVTYVDHAVTPGGRYGYLLGVPSQRGETFGGEVWVDIPTSPVGVPPGSLTSALDRVQPNPVTDRFVAFFTLPSAEPARLDLLDLAGRRLVSYDVSAFGAGEHHLEFAGANHLRPGMYFLRLEQAGRSRSARVVIQGGGGRPQ